MANDPFVWGSAGEQLSPGAISARRRVAEALMAQGADYSPVRSWTQGLARVANSLAGAMQMNAADNDEKAADAKTRDLLLANPLLGGAAPAASASIGSSSSLPVPAATPTVNTAGKIYNNDEASPLDPPSGQDRVNMIATILGEEKPGSPEGLGVANVVRNRAVDGSYGGDTPTAVVTAPKQFSPWNDAAGRANMAAGLANPAAVAKVSDQLDQAYGVGKYVNAGPTDPTDGKTHFYDPGSMVPVNAVPSWAQGKPYQTIGSTRFLDDPDDSTAAPAKPGTGLTRVASALGYAPSDAAPVAAAQPAPVAAQAAPAPAAVAQPQIPPQQVGYIKSLLANPNTRAAGVALLSQYAKPHETYSQQTDADGNIWSINNQTGQRTVAKAAEASPSSVREFEYGQSHPDFVQQQLAKTKAGAAQLNNNVDLGTGQTYDKLMAEGIGKSHAALSNDVEGAQERLRQVNGMQAAIDAIQKNGGTTGGMGQAQALELKKTLNAGATSLGMGQPFDENSLSDAEIMQKLSRQMAGAQAKNAVGARVTNFELSNYLQANPGLSLSPTANQRLLGIQAQIESRNIAVGNAIRNATTQAMDAGQKISPSTVQKLIETYDQLHPTRDPVTGQDLTKSYALPDLQTPDSNAALAVGHETNIGNIKIKRIN